MSDRWSATDLADLHGRTVVVTGANSGIGLVTARELAGVGAHVVLAVRDDDRGRAAAATIDGSCEVRRLDLADLASVRAFAAGWTGDLDVLVNNAGVMAVPEQRTVDGFELQFATNHLGHFALTNLLLPSIVDRVVTVSSGAHRMGRIVLDDLNWERRRYSRGRAYGQSKLANLLFTLELERRLTAAGSAVRAVAAHPGYAATNLQSHSGNPITSAMMSDRQPSSSRRATTRVRLPTLYAATQDVPGASYVGPDGFQETRGHPTLVTRARRRPIRAGRGAVGGVGAADRHDVPGVRPALTVFDLGGRHPAHPVAPSTPTRQIGGCEPGVVERLHPPSIALVDDGGEPGVVHPLQRAVRRVEGAVARATMQPGATCRAPSSSYRTVLPA